jgi:hypothetical protein
LNNLLEEYPWIVLGCGSGLAVEWAWELTLNNLEHMGRHVLGHYFLVFWLQRSPRKITVFKHVLRNFHGISMDCARSLMIVASTSEVDLGSWS